jgi:hypothetical protein
MRSKTVRRKLAAVTIASAFAISGVGAGAAFGANPHAGDSGHFKGSAKPCKNSSSNPNCPPFGG